MNPDTIVLVWLYRKHKRNHKLDQKLALNLGTTMLILLFIHGFSVVDNTVMNPDKTGFSAPNWKHLCQSGLQDNSESGHTCFHSASLEI